jgi:hypothetical protein
MGNIVEVSQAQLAETEAEIGSAKARYQYLLSQAVMRFETGSMECRSQAGGKPVLPGRKVGVGRAVRPRCSEHECHALFIVC